LLTPILEVPQDSKLHLSPWGRGRTEAARGFGTGEGEPEVRICEPHPPTLPAMRLANALLRCAARKVAAESPLPRGRGEFRAHVLALPR
jgi:hypothetical protein